MSQKRKQRTYKITDEDYIAAMKVAAKKNKKLAQLIEKFVQKYGKIEKPHLFIEDSHD